MADTTVTTAPQGQDTTSQVKVDDVKTTETKTEEPWKAEIAGLNSANSKLQSELKKITDQLETERLSKLSVEEQAAAKLKAAQSELEAVSNQSRSIKIENALLTNGLSKDFASLISGKTDEEITASIKVLKDKIEESATAKAEAERNKLFANGGKDVKTAQGNQSQTMKRSDWNAITDPTAKLQAARTNKIID